MQRGTDNVTVPDEVTRPAAQRVLLIGATGFIGSRLHQALADAGHKVIPAARTAAPGVMQVDLARDTQPGRWLPRLAGIDVVVNAAGAFIERPGNELGALHEAGPRALFEAAAQAGVARVIQISALGAQSAITRYFASKDAADRHLAALPVEGVVLRPSLVFGPGGGSARMLLAVASLPVLAMPRVFDSMVQPVHVDDLAFAVVQLVEASEVPRHPVAAVGPQPFTLREYLQLLRLQLGLPAARILPLPDALLAAGRLFPPLARSGLLGADALKMLAAGSTADPNGFARLLGRAPREPAAFIPRDLAPALATQATLSWALPMLRGAIALLWLVSGLVSMGIFPLQESYAMLAAAGIPASLQPLMLFGAAGTDIALGLAVMFFGTRPVVWRLQIALVLFYTLVITVWLPQFWLHPFGPMTKNIPLLASFYMLQRLGMHRWNT